MALVLSIDVGTSGVRAALFDEHANELNSARVGRTASALSDFTELDPELLVEEVCAAIDELFTSPNADHIESIAISTLWHSLVGIDSEGLPTTSLLTWADTRATSFARALRDEFNETEIHNRTGCRFHSSYWPAKLLWLQHEHPSLVKRTVRWLGFAEYLCLRLFGKPIVSVSMASATGLMDQHTCDWDWDLIATLKISTESLSPIADEIDLPLTQQFVERWPALKDARLKAIVGDGAANNVGGGCATADKIALMVGTSGAMRVVYEGEPPAQLPSSLWSYRIDRKRVAVGGALSDGGGLYRWLTQSLVVEEDPIKLAAELSSLEPDAHGLTILPFWSGERSTGWTGDARGAVLGLTQQTKPVEIVRAALEAIAYRFALIATALDEVAPNAKVIATGNALRSSPVWLQILADVLGRPVMFGGSPEASIKGAALLALEAVGTIGSIAAVEILIDEVYEPDMDRHVRYQRGLKRQQEFYEKLIV
ncbi:MAG TPA: gluconokinase [Pyrinomonadaceae bacterium]